MTTYGGESMRVELRQNDAGRSPFSRTAFASFVPGGLTEPIEKPLRYFYDEWQPPLHPALFEWYFERETSRDVACHLQMTKGYPVFLGAPTVAAEATSKSSLVDRSPLALRRLTRLRSLRRVETASVESAPYSPLSGASVVFFDPPWYLDHTLRWLACAARLVRPSGALISFALFPGHVRAGAPDERNLVLEVASALGRVDISTDALVYRTPGFEQSAVSASGHDLSPSWRRGDLVTIEVRHGAGSRTLPSTVARSSSPVTARWQTVLVGDVVLAVRMGASSREFLSGAEFLAPVEGTDPSDLLLDSVSARDQRRESIGLWSSGNLVARANRAVGHLVLRLAAMPQTSARELLCRNASRSKSWRILAHMILKDERTSW